MKLSLAALASLAAVPFTAAAPIYKCSSQAGCIDFSSRKIETSACTNLGTCKVEVCLNLDTNKVTCPKDGGTVSHVCDGADTNMCTGTRSSVFDQGDGSCSVDTSFATLADNKCSTVGPKLVMCQHGSPGDTLHWVLKDGNKNSDGPADEVSTGAGTCSDPVVTCKLSEDTTLGTCGGNQGDKEMVWSYTIPADDCHGCGASSSSSTTSTTTTSSTPAPSCTASFLLSGLESIHEGSNRAYHCTGSVDYPSMPAETDIKLYAVNPNGPDEMLGSAPQSLGAAPGTASVDETFVLRCDGNNLVGPSGAHSALGANGAEVEIYTVGPCGESNKIPTVCRNDAGGGANGDPHVKTWRKKHFDFNGACDLVLLHAENFHNGLGLDIHIRTHLRKDMSYISNAAVRIGNDILEVASKGVYSVNGLESAPMPASLSGFQVTYDYVEKTRQHVFEIALGGHQKMWLKVYRDFVSVLMDAATPADFDGSVGLMGDFNTGLLMGRDGLTTIEDVSEFGFEWQITDKEPKLFQDKDHYPQYPAKCVMPEPTSDHRKLGEDHPDFAAKAEEACKHFEGDAKKDCIYDVLTTQDLAMADAGSY